MEWIDLGYDYRLPLSRESRWKVGDLSLDDFSGLLKSHGNRIRRILSCDLNLSPRPHAVVTNRPWHVDLRYGTYASRAEAYEACAGPSDPAVLVYLQVEKKSYLRASAESWFSFLPLAATSLPLDWEPMGIDVMNDLGVSEYWDISEDFWTMDPRLVNAVNASGLLEDEQLVAEIMPSLPINPANKWAMPVRIWVAPSAD